MELIYARSFSQKSKFEKYILDIKPEKSNFEFRTLNDMLFLEAVISNLPTCPIYLGFPELHILLTLSQKKKVY